MLLTIYFISRACGVCKKPEIVYTIIEKYPEFQEIYEEIAAFRQDKGAGAKACDAEQ